MSYWETIFFWISLAIYSLACGGYIYSIVFKNLRPLPKLTFFTSCGFVSSTLAIIARYLAQGHLPWSGDYEWALMGGWFIVAGTLFVGWRNKELRWLAAGTVPLVVVMMGFGVMRNPHLAPMAASLKTGWLYIHVYFAWLTFGAYALAMAAGVLYLVKEKSEKSGGAAGNPALAQFPSLARLDELVFRYIVFGFITDSLMLVAGSIWAKDLWGNYWSWDPVETWSLVSYMVYGIAIHLRVTMDWKGAKLAKFAIFALSTVIIAFFGVTWVVNSSLHFFNVR